MKVFKNKKEIEKYYNENNNTYEFIENGLLIDVKFKFNLSLQSNIEAGNIDAVDIEAWNINAVDINAWDINARDIDYYAICSVYKNIECMSIKGRRGNHKHFVLDGEIKIKKKHVIIIDDKEIELSEESYNQLKKSLL